MTQSSYNYNSKKEAATTLYYFFFDAQMARAHKISKDPGVYILYNIWGMALTTKIF